jgi:hypothetical protein
MRIFDKNGNPIEVPDEQAQELLASGQYGVPSDQEVPIKLDSGQIGSIPGKHLGDALAQGATIISADEHAAAVQQAKYGGVGGMAAAGLAGAARGASVGLSDVAARAVGGQPLANYLRNVQEANPIASGAGELAGVVAPAVLTAGTSLAEEAPGALGTIGRIAAAPGEAVSALGRLGERAVTKLLPDEATSLAGRLTQKAIGGAVRGGLEGAAYGAGGAVSEEALAENPDLDGEKFLHAMGYGALLGGATGGVLSAGGQAGREVLGAVAPRLQRMAEDYGFEALAPTAKMRLQAEEIPGGTKAIAREVLDSGLIKPGDTIADAAPRIEAAMQEQGEKIGSILARADEGGYAGPHVGTLLESLDKAGASLEELPTLNQPAITRLDALKSDLANLAGGDVGPESRLGFKQTQELRRRVDVEAKWASNPLAPVPELAKAMRSARTILEDEIERAGDEASKKVGGTFAEDYTEAKVKFQRLAIANDAAQAAAARAVSSAGPSELGALGAVGALMSGHPLAAAASLGSRAARGFVASRTYSTAAVLLDRLGALGGVQQATGAIDRQIARGVARAAGDTSVAAVKLRKPIEGGFDAMRKSVETALTDTQSHTAAISQAVSPIAQHSPRVAQAFERAAIRATLYLGHALPTSKPTSALTPKLDRDEPSDTEKAKFTRIFQAVHDPTSVLARVEDGTVTPDEVAAVQHTAPETYRAMCSQLTDALSTVTDPKKLPYARRLSISTFLGQPVDATMTPTFVAQRQATFATLSPPPSKEQEKKRGGHAKASQLSLAASTRLADQGSKEA